MTDQEIYKKYLELLPYIKEGQISKTKAAETLGFVGVKRPDDKLRRWVKAYEAKGEKQEEAVHHITHHTPKREVENIKPEGLAEISGVHTFFQDKGNIEALIKMVGEYRGQGNKGEDLEVLDTNLPLEYRRIANTQRSIRCNPTLWKDWEKTLKKDHNLADLHQSDLLNLTLVWAMEKLSKG